MDLLPTVCEAAGIPYPEERGGQKIKPASGTPLLPVFSGKELPDRIIPTEHQGARGLRRGDWKIVWGKRQTDEVLWELYNLRTDPCEQNDLASGHPDIVRELSAAWENWARTVGAEPFHKIGGVPADGKMESPRIAGRSLEITAEVEAKAPDGVVLSHGGNKFGYALHFVDGEAVFSVRHGEEITVLKEPGSLKGKIRLRATLDADAMTLRVNDGEVRSLASPGLIPVQPQDGFTVGSDPLSTVGDYGSPNRFSGKVLSHEVRTGKVPEPLKPQPAL
jgi:arylsulfatase